MVACCLMNVCLGLIYAWSVFATPMAEYLTEVSGQKVESLAIVFTIANSLGPITMIGGGIINDKVGPRWIMLFGGILYGVGMISSGFVTSASVLTFFFGFVLGFGGSMVYGVVVSNSVKFFPDHKGLAGGISTAAYGSGAIIMPGIANALIESQGVTNSFKILGVVMTSIILVSSFFVKKCPPDFVPEGYTPPQVTVKSGPADKNFKGMLTDGRFYLMVVMLLCGAFSGLMITSQASGVAQNMIGMTAASAAVVVSVLAVFNTAGRILSGFISDKLGEARTLIIVFLLILAGQVMLFVSPNIGAPVFVVGVCMIGFGFGSIMGIYPGFTASQFGLKNNSVNYGIMFIGFAASSNLGPLSMSAIYTSGGSYQPAFVIAGILSLVGIVFALIFLARARRKSAAILDN